MRNFMILTAATFLVVISSISGGKGSNDAVQFSVTAETAAKGSALLFSLHPKKGIHINLEPGLLITADSSSGVTLSGKPEIPVDAKTNFLDESKPIRQTFRRAPHAADSVTISGTMTYYYCSDEEGWCSRFKQPFSLKLRVAQ